MKFLRNFLWNLGLLLGIGVVLFLIYPDMMRQIFQLYGAFLGPGLVILIVVVAALPRRSRR